jgi:hypothetical protein
MYAWAKDNGLEADEFKLDIGYTADASGSSPDGPLENPDSPPTRGPIPQNAGGALCGTTQSA